MKNGLRGKTGLFVPVLAVLLFAAAALGSPPAAEDTFALDERFEAWFREPPDTLSRIEGSMAELSEDGTLLRVGFPHRGPFYLDDDLDDTMTSSVLFMKGLPGTTPQFRFRTYASTSIWYRYFVKMDYDLVRRQPRTQVTF